MFKKTLIASTLALAVLASVGSTYAADLQFVTPAVRSEAPAPVGTWDGFYVGLNGIINPQGDAPALYGVGINAGYDKQIGVFLVGGEVELSGIDRVQNLSGSVLGKAGVVVTRDVAVFGLAGVSADLNNTANRRAVLGGGVEYRISDNISLKGEYKHGFVIDDVNRTDSDAITVGVSFKF